MGLKPSEADKEENYTIEVFLTILDEINKPEKSAGQIESDMALNKLKSQMGMI